ncbi:hypothetical protein V6Z11_D04G155000 [Gossypium hirsutum]
MVRMLEMLASIVSRRASMWFSLSSIAEGGYSSCSVGVGSCVRQNTLLLRVVHVPRGTKQNAIGVPTSKLIESRQYVRDEKLIPDGKMFVAKCVMYGPSMRGRWAQIIA